MAGNRELGFPKTNTCSLKEQLLRKTLHNVRSKGHIYVELREVGKRLIFFCTLCLAPCYSDSVLFDHLRGSLHAERYAAAEATLLKPNPWPFNDGVLFFHDSVEQGSQLLLSDAKPARLLENRSIDENSLAIVSNLDDLSPISSNERDTLGNVSSVGLDLDCDNSCCDTSSIVTGDGYDLIVPAVLLKDEVSDLKVRLLGVGHIAARYYEKDGVSKGICKIWCEWLGKNDSVHEDVVMIPEHDFAIVTFTFNYDLGRKGLLNEVRCLLSSSGRSEIGGNENAKVKKRKSLSDPEDISESLRKQYDSSGEESLSSSKTSSRTISGECDDNLLHERVFLSKSRRRDLRRQQHVAAERMCDLCQHKMLPGKDVGALLNRKTGRIVCSSRNVNGAFHVYHISCLMHWILFCDFEVSTKQLVSPKPKQRSRRKIRAKVDEIEQEAKIKAPRKQIYSVFCPECQGTGIDIDGEELEKPTVPLSEMFKHKLKLSEAHKSWMKNPEMLENCSTGFYFPLQSEERMQENATPLKLLHFYRADE